MVSEDCEAGFLGGRDIFVPYSDRVPTTEAQDNCECLLRMVAAAKNNNEGFSLRRSAQDERASVQ